MTISAEVVEGVIVLGLVVNVVVWLDEAGTDGNAVGENFKAEVNMDVEFRVSLAGRVVMKDPKLAVEHRPLRTDKRL